MTSEAWTSRVWREHEERKARVARADAERAERERQYDLECSDRWANAPLERPRLARK